MEQLPKFARFAVPMNMSSDNRNFSIIDSARDEIANRQSALKQLETIDLSALNNSNRSSASFAPPHQSQHQPMYNMEEYHPIQASGVGSKGSSMSMNDFQFPMGYPSKESNYGMDQNRMGQAQIGGQNSVNYPGKRNKNQMGAENSYGGKSLSLPSPIKNTQVAQEMNRPILDQNLMCLVCGKHFMDKRQLAHHLCEHAGKKLLTCMMCGKASGYANMSEHEGHNGIGEPHICRSCDGKFAPPSSHESQSKAAAEAMNSRPTFNPISVDDNRQKPRVEEKKVECETCGKRFKTYSSLAAHKETAHAQTGPHICATCGKDYADAGKLKRHLITHAEGRFSCELCGKRFKSRYQLKTHEGIDADRKPIICGVCGQQFCRINLLISHQVNHTGGLFTCDICGKGYKQKGQLKYHYKTHTEKKTTESGEQQEGNAEAIRSNEQLNEGRVSMSDEQSAEYLQACRFKGQSASGLYHPGSMPFNSANNIPRDAFGTPGPSANAPEKKHVYGLNELLIDKKSLSASRSFECKTCGKFFKTSGQLKAHQKIDSAQKPILCLTCNQEFCRLNLLITHQATHTGGMFVCDYCNKAFKTRNQLTKHHAHYRGKDAHKCDICPRAYCAKPLLMKHKIIHGEVSFAYNIHGQHPIENDGMEAPATNHEAGSPTDAEGAPLDIGPRRAALIDRIDSANRTYQCEICVRRFKTKGHLKAHQNLDADKKPIICETCNQTFCTIRLLVQHRAMHTGGVFACETCGKKFKKKTELLKHHLAFKGKDVQVCNVCNKSFCGKGQLLKHMSTHSTNTDGRSLFDCTVCGKGFRVEKNLKKHMKRHEDEEMEVPETADAGETTDKSFSVVKEPAAAKTKEPKGKRTRVKKQGRMALKKAYLKKHVPSQKSKTPAASSSKGNAKASSKESPKSKQPEKRKMKIVATCESCGKGFSSKANLDRHLSAYKGMSITCSVCSKSFCTPGSLAKHLKKHRYSSVTSETPEADAEEECQLCKEQDLDHDKESPEHGTGSLAQDADESMEQDASAGSSQKSSMFECEHCVEQFREKSQLEGHQKSYIDGRPHCCGMCSKPFCDVEQLLEHQKINH